MAYVGEPFCNDIFVSYSHGADAQGDATLQDWSLAFVQALKNELRATPAFRNSLALFVDDHDAIGRGIDPMAPLTDQLEAQVGASALLLVLLSSDYQASHWCQAEREWWWQRQAATGVPPAGRVALVRSWPDGPWPGGRWPAELSDAAGQPLVGYRFHAGEGYRARPLGWTQWRGGFDQAVLEAVVGLAGDLCQKLDEVKAAVDRQCAVRAEARRLADPAGQAVYLHGRVDRARDWERAAEDLLAGGYAVLPGEPDPLERDPARIEALRERRVETLTGCDALMLLGSPDGRAIDADLIVVGKHDRNSARARSNRWLPCALLDTTGAPVATPVRRAAARAMQTDWLDVSQGPLVPVVQRWLVDKAALAAQG